jgi:copper(I)-binding protein
MKVLHCFKSASAALLVSIVLSACARAGSGEPGVTDAAYRAPLGASTVGVLYMTVESPADDAVVGLSSPQAERIELHESTLSEHGMAGMKALETLPLPAGKPVELKPGGVHAMVFSPAPLGPDEVFSVTLELKSGKRLNVEAHSMTDR